MLASFATTWKYRFNPITLILSTLITVSLGLAGCQSQETITAAPDGAEVGGNPEKFLIVDCLLPGQVRKLGSSMTYVSPRRPVKTSATECEIRGGEYVAFDRADYRTALNVWLPMAQQGDPEAQNYVGEIYEKGLGIQPDYQTAAAWYQKAAEQGNSRARINLGFLYEKGLGVNKDLAEALNWYRKASGLEQDNLQFSSSIEISKAERNELRLLKQERQQQQAESEQLRQQLQKTQGQLSAQRKKLNEAQDRMLSLRQQIDQYPTPTLTTAQVPVPDNSAELEQLRQQLSQQEAIVQNQQQSISTLESQLSDQRTEMQGALQFSAQENQQLQEALQQQSGEIVRLKKKFDQTQAELVAANQVLQKQQPKLADQRSQLEATQKSLIEATNKTITLEQEVARLTEAQRNSPERDLQQERLTEAQRELVAAKTLAARKEQELKQLRTAEQQYLDEIQKQQVKIDRYQAEALRYRTQLTDLRSQQKTAALTGPSIEIIDPPIALTRGMPSIRLRSAARERIITGKVMAPAGLVSFTVNDKGLQPDPLGIFTTRVAVEDEQTPVRMMAVDKQGQSTSLEFLLIPKMRYAGQSSTPDAQQPLSETPNRLQPRVNFGKFYALIIGNNQYQNFPNLVTASYDAQETADILRNKYGFSTTVLMDATRYDMLSALNQLREELTENDNLLIYYAGHGELDRVNLRGYWLPVDAEPNSTANWISNIAITDILNAMSAKHILVVADSCYSGALTRSSMARLDAGMSSEAKDKWLKVMAKTRSRTVLTSGGLKPVLDQGGGKHSVFARFFLKSLQDNDDILEAYSLFRSLAKEVQKTASRFGIDQIPEYAPIKHGGHEAGEFFFIPKG
ncbi:MAG: caspase family protein [Candidatus Thiodiazotropha sp.]